MIAAAPRRRAAPQAPAAKVVRAPSGVQSPFVGYKSNPLRGVEWSISYVAFIAYIIAITTYRIPIGTEAMGLALVALPLEKRGLRFPKVAVLTCTLVAWSFLGWTTTDYPEVVFDTITEFAKVCAVILVAVNVLTTRNRLRAFIVIFMISYMIYPVRGSLIGWATGGNTIDGRAIWNVTYSNPNDLAGLTILQLACCLGMLEVEKSWWVKVLGWSGAILLPLVVILTQSRGAFIALVAILLIGGRKVFRSPRKLLMLALLGVFVVIVAPDKVWKRFSSVQDAVDVESINVTADEASSSTVQRLEIWKVARTMIAENLISGVGMGGYSSAHYIYAQRPNFLPLAMGRRDTHSTYLNMFAETGVVGFGIFCAILIVSLKAGHSARKRVGSIGGPQAMQVFYLELGLYGYLVAGIWGSYGKLIPTYVHLALICVAANLLQEEYDQARGGVARPVRRGMRVPAGAAAQFSGVRA